MNLWQITSFYLSYFLSAFAFVTILPIILQGLLQNARMRLNKED